MTPFEIIIIGFIYLFCLGFTMEMFLKEENIWFRIILVLLAFVLAIYAPLFIGGAIYEKLNNKISSTTHE